MRIAKAVVKRSAIVHNYEKIKAFCGHRPVMAVLKANAYGHGIGCVAKTLSHADSIGVASIQEAIQLRQEGITQCIVLLEGINHKDELDLVEHHGLDVVVHNDTGLALMCGYPFCKPIRVWLKLDTGMHRLGYFADAFEQAHTQLKQQTWLKELILMSHLACADDINSPVTQQQLKRFNEVTEKYSDRKCVANSAGTLAWPEAHYDYVRSGLMLFGCSPLIGGIGSSHQLIPAMEFKSEVIAIKSISAGESLGYGYAWTADKDTQIAIVSVGYGDGYPRHAANGTPVYIKNRNYSLVGRVTMDMITVELGPDSDVAIGDSVVLWGEKLPVEIIAQHSNTIPYQLLCNFTKRVDLSLVD